MKQRAARVFFAALLVSAASRAQPSPDAARADALFTEGQGLMEAHRVREACAKFEESQRLDPTLGTLLNVADCHAQDERTATAWREFTQALSLAIAKGRHERERFVRTQLAELEKRLSFVRLEPAPSPATRMDRVVLDGAELSPDVWGNEFPIDPGPHVFVVHASGKRERRVDFVAGRGPARGTLKIAFEDQAPSDPPKIPPPPVAVLAAPPSRPPR
jgi:hypothetical protein